MRLQWKGEAFRAQVIAPALEAGMDAAAARLNATMKGAIQRKGSPSAPGEPPRSVTGDAGLKGSVQTWRLDRGEMPVRWVGTTLAYGRHLEFGANPRSRFGKKITVPLNEAARKLRRRHPNLAVSGVPFRVVPLKDGRALLISEAVRPKRDRYAGTEMFDHGGGGGVEGVGARFLLTDSVKILPRPWLRPALRDVQQSGVMQSAVRRAMNQAIKAGAAAFHAGGAR